MAAGISARATAWWRARRLTDEQYVERIRKNQRAARKVFLVLLCLLAVVAIVAIPNLGRAIYTISKTLMDSEMDALLFAVGLGIGAHLGFFAYALYSCLILVLFGDRSATLMLKFHDELENRKHDASAAEGSANQ